MLVSIVTCIFETRFNFFYDCIKSIELLKLNKDYFEWLIIDDGSTAQYYNKLSQIVADLSTTFNIRLFRLPVNQGLSIARNRAITEAKGEFIQILDADDRLDKYIAQTLWLKIPSHACLGYCNSIYFSNSFYEFRDKHKFHKCLCKHFDSIYNPFFWYDFLYQGPFFRTLTFKKMGGYDEELSFGEDLDLILRMLEITKPKEIYFCQNVGYYYRYHREGICQIHWEEVKQNYEKTFLRAINKRSRKIISCRYNENVLIGNSKIDTYTYKHKELGWLNVPFELLYQ